MKINTALILCAGYGKRLNPVTLKIPKPLLELKSITMLEHCIRTILSLKIKKIIINTFHLKEQITDFIKNRNFSADIEVIEDGLQILNTGGGILNMMKSSADEDYLIFNPDTLWNEKHIDEINMMQNFYFENELSNVLLIVEKKLSFDENLLGDFQFQNNLLKKNSVKNFIYTGCQILNKSLFDKHKISNFPVSEIWNELLKKNNLNGYESSNKFYHLTNLEIFKKLKDL